MYKVEALPRATAKRKRKIKQKKLASANCCYLQEETVSLDGWSGYSGSIFIQLQHQGAEHVAKGGTLHDSSGMLAQHLFFFFGKCSVPAFSLVHDADKHLCHAYGQKGNMTTWISYRSSLPESPFRFCFSLWYWPMLEGAICPLIC